MNQERNLDRTSLAKGEKREKEKKVQTNSKQQQQQQQQAKTERKEQHIIIGNNNSTDNKDESISRKLLTFSYYMYIVFDSGHCSSIWMWTLCDAFHKEFESH